ncbi:MAG: inositol monophosphatase [Spirochaetales bacterium]|nr:inositol monophosphatase [Spirochaetales bacterium]
MTDGTDKVILRTAKKAAYTCGKIMLRGLHTAHTYREKTEHYDIVTETDEACEKAAVEAVRKIFPGHNILAEEHDYSPTASPYTWIIDPLDGTNNFSHRLPCFSVSIACAREGGLIAGVVYNPVSGEMFSACRGKGAFLNNNKITVSHANQLKESLLITGFYYDRGDEMVRTLDNIREFLSRGIMGIRRFGSAALDLCNVACGRADGYWEFLLNPWDFAAGKLIVEEAGGKITDRDGNDVNPLKPSYIVSSNTFIHPVMLGVLGKP